MHRATQQRAPFLQPSDRQHPGFPADGDEVSAELFAVFAHVPRERVRSRRGLFAGLAAVDEEQLRFRGHFLQERGGGEIREGRDVRLDRPAR